MLRNFCAFLDNNQRKVAIQQNLHAGFSLFHQLPLASGEEDYFKSTDLLRELIEAKFALNITIADLENTSTLNEARVKQALADKFDLWMKKAIAAAVTDLFDADGHILPSIKCSLPHHEESNEFKLQLLASYIADVVIHSESCSTSMQSLHLDKIFNSGADVLYGYFKHYVADSMQPYYQHTPTFNSQLISIIHKNAEYIPPAINPLFTDSNDPMLTEQEIIERLLGIKINQLLLNDFEKSGNIVALVLQDTKLTNYVLKKFKLFGIENIPDDGLSLLYSAEFSPYVHTNNNLTRAYNHAYDVFGDQLDALGYSKEIVLSPYATSIQREILILGAILWQLPIWYITKFYNPDHAKTKDIYERLAIEKRFRTEPLEKLAEHFPLATFASLLKAISNQYIPNHDAIDHLRITKEFTKKVVIESLLCPAKTNNLLQQYNYILKANVSFPFELYQLAHQGKLVKKGDTIHLSGPHAPASILDSSNCKTEKYFNAETEAYVAALPIWQRLHVGAVIISLHIAFTHEQRIDEDIFIAATREITVLQLSTALQQRQQANDDYINHFVSVFSALETYETGNVKLCDQFKEKFVGQIKHQLHENNWFSKGKPFIQYLSKNCETFVEILEASKSNDAQNQANTVVVQVVENKPDDAVVTSKPAKDSYTRLKNGLAIAAIATGLTLTIITASIFTAGLILVPVAIALFAVGGSMVAGTLIGAIVDYFKRSRTTDPSTPPSDETSYKQLADAGLRPERVSDNRMVDHTPSTPTPPTQGLNLPTHTATITPRPN